MVFWKLANYLKPLFLLFALLTAMHDIQLTTTNSRKNKSHRQTQLKRILSSHTTRLLGAALAASVLLAACGGGGDSSQDPAAVANRARRNPSTPATTTPATTTASTGKIFYGVNGHFQQGGAYASSSTQTQLAQLQDLGMTIYRSDVSSKAAATALAQIATTMAAGGVTVYPVLLISPQEYSSETASYNAGYALGQQVASAMHASYYEVGNELEADTLAGNYDGTFPTDYVNSKFMIARGAIRGMIDGIKSVDTQGKIVMGAGTWLHWGFDQMLAQGTQPDGTAGHPVVSWDVTAWHWYNDYDDIQNICGGSGCYNVLSKLQAFGKPIWLTEYGVRPWTATDSQAAAYLTGNTMMAEYASVASTYNLQSIQMYELYDDPAGTYGLLQSDGTTKKPQYASVKSFIASHPK
ncbi:glycosyl hydrolase [Paraburkholderia aromaticivorans]|uniref:glycosyl hydrolase n=1 Tax=Paraburkholderia aromaticivorans TaxID=2026199 RepID=UPI001FC99CBE|nr:glycosyl hydrolase [Paraburkholderia aromaticivorans]